MQKKYSHLNQGHIHRISALERAGHSISFIAGHLGVSQSTVSRELKRSVKKIGSYIAIRKISPGSAANGIISSSGRIRLQEAICVLA